MASTLIRAAILTASDTRDEKSDLSGQRLEELLRDLGAEVVERLIVSDDLNDLRNTIHSLAMRDDVNLLITTGGTGLGPRDNTPEATQAVIEREVPGIAEAIRAASLAKTSMAMISRGICGVREGTLIINFPGSPKAVEECFEVVRPVLEHAIDLISGKTSHEAC
jgi:molybdenum cofactor synthesis domain-containing protein